MASKQTNKTYLLDTNVILRFLLNDHEEYSKQAKQIFKQIFETNTFGRINHVTIAETYFVLTRVYKIPRQEVIEKLILLFKLDNIKIYNKHLILKILTYLQQHSISFVDIYNLFYAVSQKAELATFDRRLKRLYKQVG